MTIGYIPHIPTVVGNGRNSRPRLVVSDARNELVQKSFALMLRQLVRASERGARVDMGRHGHVLLEPRVMVLAAYEVEEPCVLSLMRKQCMFNRSGMKSARPPLTYHKLYVVFRWHPGPL